MIFIGLCTMIEQYLCGAAYNFIYGGFTEKANQIMV